MRTHYESQHSHSPAALPSLLPLLRRSPMEKPKFVVVDSDAGRLVAVESAPFCLTAYGTKEGGGEFFVVKQMEL
jgi:hypothetical protein